MEAVDGVNGNTRCSEMSDYCCPVSLCCTAYQDVGDTVGNIVSLSDMESSRHWRYNSRHWRWHCCNSRHLRYNTRHWCCIWLDVPHVVVDVVVGGDDDDVLQSLEDPCLFQVKML